MIISDKLLAGSDNDVYAVGIQDTRDDSYPVNASVTCNIYDRYGVLIAGAGPITMTYVAGTTGEDTAYRGSVPATAALGAMQSVTRKITAVGAASAWTRVFTKEILVTLS